MRALLVLALSASVAQANPILIDRDPPPPPPPPPTLVVAVKEAPPAPPLRSRLGLRVGAGAFPLDGITTTALGLVQLTADVELFRRTRTFAEYEFLMLMQTPSDPMEKSPSGIGHRGNLGVSVEVLGKTFREAHFSVTAEAGGGATLISAALGARALPHAFGGIRLGFDLVLDKTTKPPPAFGFELLVRGLVVPDGAGVLFGLGLQWGE